MPLLKKEEKEKLYAGHSMKLEDGKWVHDGESARVVITFGKSKLKDGLEREEILVHIDHKSREQSFTYSTKTPTSLSPALSSIDMEFDRKTAKLLSFKSFTEYVHKIEFEVNLKQEKEWLNDFLASREEECTYKGLKMESQGPQEGLTGRSNEVWRSEWKDGEHATIQITDNFIGVTHHKKHGEDGVDYEKKFTPQGEMFSIYSRSDSLGGILTLDVGMEEDRVRRFLFEPEEVKKSRLKDFGRMLFDRIKREGKKDS